MSEPGFSNLRAEVPLLVVGCDFRLAASALREKLVTTPEERKLLFDAIRDMDDTAGFLVLETCNRLEWVVSTRLPEWIGQVLSARILDRWQQCFPGVDFFPSPYIYTAAGAVDHVLRVVVGLESLAAGEAQIAGQFQLALKRARKEKTTSPIINRLGHIAGRIARSGYKIGFRSNYRQGIHGLVVKFLEKHFQTGLDRKFILVAGMGEIGRRTAALVEETFKCRVQALNRTVTPARRDQWEPLTQLESLAPEADALIVATGGTTAVIDVPHLGLDRRTEPLPVMDIGIPRQVTGSAQGHPLVRYRNIDHLLELGEGAEKSIYSTQLEEEIQCEAGQFKQFCRAREMTALLGRIHSGRLELTEKRIPDFVSSRLSDLEETRRKEIEQAIKQFIKDYSNNLFQAFHQTMEAAWSSNEQ